VVKPLTLANLNDCLALSTASNWNQTADDWHRALTLPGTTAWGIEREGRIVSTTTAIRYGDDLAWIGMVLTAEPYRGQGRASALIAAALDWLSGCECIKLDATAQGAPLYRKFGFDDEGVCTRYIGRATKQVESDGEPGPDAFEADRTALLATLGKPKCLPDGSFAYARPGRVTPFFGPCVGDGDQLLKCFEGEYLLDRLGPAPEGFRPARELMRMYKGKLKRTSERQFACAGFEFG
jgi:GNAT superfamily N-acetyltransferase